MGIHPERFSWTLDKGEEFQTPEVVMVYSEHGLNGMSQTYHRLFQNIWYVAIGVIENDLFS